MDCRGWCIFQAFIEEPESVGEHEGTDDEAEDAEERDASNDAEQHDERMDSGAVSNDFCAHYQLDTQTNNNPCDDDADCCSVLRVPKIEERGRYPDDCRSDAGNEGKEEDECCKQQIRGNAGEIESEGGGEPFEDGDEDCAIDDLPRRDVNFGSNMHFIFKRNVANEDLRQRIPVRQHVKH